MTSFKRNPLKEDWKLEGLRRLRPGGLHVFQEKSSKRGLKGRWTPAWLFAPLSASFKRNPLKEDWKESEFHPASTNGEVSFQEKSSKRGLKDYDHNDNRQEFHFITFKRNPLKEDWKELTLQNLVASSPITFKRNPLKEDWKLSTFISELKENSVFQEKSSKRGLKARSMDQAQGDIRDDLSREIL